MLRDVSAPTAQLIPGPLGTVQVPCPLEVFPEEERGLQHPHPLLTGARWSLIPQPANSHDLPSVPTRKGSQSAPASSVMATLVLLT